MKILYCKRLRTHTYTHTCFQIIVLPVSFSLSLDSLEIISIRVYLCIQHTHTRTHTFSVYFTLSCIYVRDRERDVSSLSREVCVRKSRWWRRREESLSVSCNSWHHSVEPICRTAPERKGSREIWSCRFTNTHAETFRNNPWIILILRERRERERLDTETRISRAHV